MKKFLAAVALLGLVALNSFAAEKSSPPNIIFVLADDLGIGNISCYGADNFKTPNIDALAKSGIRYTHCYAQPLCGPSRAQLLTGRYAFRTGMTGNDSGILISPKNEVMIPKMLKTAGYSTGHVGKWGQLPLEPADFGFDEYLRFQGSGIYWSEQAKGGSYWINGKNVRLPKNKYMPDLMHEFAIDFITRHKSQPFFLYYSMSHVHTEMLRTPDSAPDSKDFYTDNINYMDKLVGKLVAELEHLHLREKTLVIFVGDNGTVHTELARSTIGGKTLSGHKGELLENGSLVPMIANWPKTVPAGKVSDDLMDFSDYLPTFAELTGTTLPAGVKIDGRSFAAPLQGKAGHLRDWVFVELGRHWYAREMNWKLNEQEELFDMKNAPFEEKLVTNETSESKAARQRLQAVLKELNPAGGKVDAGDGSGRHDKSKKKNKKKKE